MNIAAFIPQAASRSQTQGLPAHTGTAQLRGRLLTQAVQAHKLNKQCTTPLLTRFN